MKHYINFVRDHEITKTNKSTTINPNQLQTLGGEIIPTEELSHASGKTRTPDPLMRCKSPGQLS